MTNDQALALLFQAARQARLSAEEHGQVQQAAEILQAAIKPKEDKKK